MVITIIHNGIKTVLDLENLPSPGGDGVLLTQEITLVKEQLEVLHITPVEFIPAPGENKVIVIHNVAFYYEYLDAAYTVDNYIFQLHYGNSSMATGSSPNMDLGGSLSRFRIIGPASSIGTVLVFNSQVECVSLAPIVGDGANGKVHLVATYSIADYN